jgi:hypothetical protein
MTLLEGRRFVRHQTAVPQNNPGAPLDTFDGAYSLDVEHINVSDEDRS